MGNARIKGITIEIGASTTKLTEALKGVNSHLKTTQSALTDINKLLKLDPSNTELLKQKQQALGEQIYQTSQKLEKLKAAQKNMEENGVDKNSEQYQALRREIIETENKLKSLEEQSRQTKIEMSAFTKVGDAFQTVGGKITDVGNKLKALSLAATAALAACVKITADFDTSMSQVQATMGIANDEMVEFNGTMVEGREVMAALSAKAQEMGATTKFTASESADALNYLALAGYSAEKQIDALPAVLTLAAAGDMDLAYASDLVTDSMSVLGLSTDTLTTFIDQMAKTASSSNTNVAQLGEAILVAGGQASICEMSTSELNTALGVLADNGMKGSQGGTMLRNALKNLYTPTDKASDYMLSLGFATQTAEGEIIPLQKVLVDLGVILDGMTSGEKVTAMAQIFDTRTIGAANALLKSVGVDLGDIGTELAQTAVDWSKYGFDANACIDEIVYNIKRQKDEQEIMTYLVDEYGMAMEDAEAAVSALSSTMDTSGSRFDELQAKIEDSGGAAEKMATTQLDNLNGSLTILKSALEGAAIKLGSKLTPSLKKLAEAITRAVDKFNALDDATAETVLKVIAITAAAAPLLIVMGSVISSIGTIAKAIPVVATALTSCTGVIGLAAAGIAALVIASNNWVQSWENARIKAQSLTESQQALKDEVDSLAESYQTMKTAQDAAYAHVEFHTQREKDLWAALQNIVTENGLVLAGHEAEAEFITGKLSEALGLNIELIDGQIQGYEELASSIDNVILKKEAESLLSAAEDGYTTAIQNRNTALKDREQALSNVEYQTGLLYAAEERAERIQNAYNAAMEESNKYGTDMSDTAIKYGNALDEATVSIEDHKLHLEALNSLYAETDQVLKDYTTEISNYESLLAATVSGNSEELQNAIDAQLHHLETAETGTYESLKAQREHYNTEYKEMKRLVDDGATYITDKQVAEAKRMRDLSYEEFRQWVENSNAQYQANTTNVTAESEKMAEEGFNGANKFGINMDTELRETVIPMVANDMTDMEETSIQPTVNAMPTYGENSALGLLSGWNIGFPQYREQVLADLRQLNADVEAYELINSPSKRWAKIGQYMAEGLGKGWGKEFSTTSETILESMKSLVAPVQKASTINLSSPVYLDGKLLTNYFNQQLGVML